MLCGSKLNVITLMLKILKKIPKIVEIHLKGVSTLETISDKSIFSAIDYFPNCRSYTKETGAADD